MTDKILIDLKLLPCPFCGQQLEVSSRKFNPFARCATDDCKGGQLPLLNIESSRDVSRWNTRAILALPAPEVEAVEVVAHCAFADNGNIRMWGRSASTHCELIDSEGNKAAPLMTVDQHNRIVKQLASK